jgi:4-hydroxybenzoate polyprenyltransferase
MTDENKPSNSRILAYLQLMRLPNVFTAMADICLSFGFTDQDFSRRCGWALLLVSSSCLYTAGMVLNDVFDVEQDRRERPHRPIPSGRISRMAAIILGCSLMIVGLAAGGIVYVFLIRNPRLPPLLASLAAAILLYNRFLKRTILGPPAMGICRYFNVLLGRCVVLADWSVAVHLVAGGIGVYVAGVTWFASREAKASGRIHLIGGLVLAMCGILMLWWLINLGPIGLFMPFFVTMPHVWTSIWITIAGFIGWRFFIAIVHPEPTLVQAAVKSGILSIILLDATIVTAFYGIVPGLAVVSLLVPAIVLGRWVYST